MLELLPGLILCVFLGGWICGGIDMWNDVGWVVEDFGGICGSICLLCWGLCYVGVWRVCVG